MPARFEPVQSFVDHRVHDGNRGIDSYLPPVCLAVDKRVLVVQEALRDAALADLGEHAHEQRRTLAPLHGV